MEGSVAETKAQIIAISYQASREIVDVYKTILRDGQPIVEVIPQLSYRGTSTSYKNMFQRKIETLMQLHIGSSRDPAGFRSKEWSHLYDPETKLF